MASAVADTAEMLNGCCLVENSARKIDSNGTTEQETSSALSTPTTGNDDVSTCSSLDNKDGAIVRSHDVAGLVDLSPRAEGDAAPFSGPNYQQRYREGFLDRVFQSWNQQVYETFSEKHSPIYDVSKGRRLAVVFNQEDFPSHRDLSRRNGTDRDCEEIQKTFRALNFDVEIYNDPDLSKIQSVMSQIQKTTDLSCLALFILTHGEENGLLHARDKSYWLNREIINELVPLQCPSLAGKPKLIFIQACQGSETDSGVRLQHLAVRSRHTSTDNAVSGGTYCIPNFADFLIFQAAYHGYYSFRSSSGSWFIQALCHEIAVSSPDDELLAILTRVSRNVAVNKSSNAPNNADLHDKKQIPLRQDTLVRSVFLKKKDEPLQRQEVDQEVQQSSQVPKTSQKKSLSKKMSCSVC